MFTLTITCPCLPTTPPRAILVANPGARRRMGLTRGDDTGGAAAVAPTPTEAKRSSALCEEPRHGPSHPSKPPATKQRPDWLFHWRSSPPRPQCSSSLHYMPKMSYTREHGNEENVAPRDAQSGKKRASARVSSSGASSLRNGLAATSLLLSKAGGLQRRTEEGDPSAGSTQPVVAELTPAATATTPAAKLSAAVEATPLLGAPPLVASSGDAAPAGGTACAAQCRCVIS